MDIKKGKAFLIKPRLLDNKIKRLEYEIEELRTFLEPNAIRYDVDKVISTPKDSMSEVFAKIDELERELNKTKAEKYEIIVRISDLLSALPESPEKAVLYGFYLHRMPMGKIAHDLKYDICYCYKLRNKGIKQLKEN